MCFSLNAWLIIMTTSSKLEKLVKLSWVFINYHPLGLSYLWDQGGGMWFADLTMLYGCDRVDMNIIIKRSRWLLWGVLVASYMD